MRRDDVAVVIATVGRPAAVRDFIEHFRQQTVQCPILVACVGPDDIPPLPSDGSVKVVFAPKGLTRQRNAGLSALGPQVSFVVFFDDDFVPAHDWLERALEIFEAQSDIRVLTGHVIADGINGDPIPFEAARALLETDVVPPGPEQSENYSAYGCNMAYRISAIGAERFDERLPLYGWQEDRDFAARVSKGGRMIKLSTARGVHCGLRAARVPGVRLGYSQVINPIYLVRKGTMSVTTCVDHIGRNVGMNAVGSLTNSGGIDRRGRLWGNVLGATDLLRGRLQPERAERLGLSEERP